MSFFEKSKTKLLSYFNNLFASPKPKKRRVVFFVSLAILVLGVLAQSSLAKTIPGDPPKPGSPIPANWQQAINNYSGSYADRLKYLTADGNVPTSPSEYGSFLKVYGGYTWQETDQAGIKYANDLVSKPENNTWYQSLLGGTTDDSILAKWKQGQGVPEPPITQKVDATIGLAGNSIGNWFASKVWDVVIGVLAILAYFCKLLLMYAGQALDVTLNPNLYSGIANNQMVVGGWIIVRDVCNLFFLLVLLFIAICTILKIEKYHAKKTLLMLIIMALLINFSKPIAVFIFDGSQLLMNMFLSEITKSGQGSPSAKLAGDIAKFLYNDLTAQLNTQKGSMEIAVYYLFLVVFLFMFAVALFVMAIFMIIRIIAIMILVIVSPLAFFAAIVPDFSKMSSKWWSSLFEYSYYGPAAAFFIFLATKFSIASSTSNILPQINIQGGGSIVIQRIIQYLVVLVFLYASIIMAKQFGGGAGAAIVGNANRFMKWAGGMTKGGGMWGAGASLTGASDVYKGIRGGVAKQPYWRILTKEGWDARHKERQERWEGRVAPFNIANVKKNAKEMENDSKAKIDTGVKNGSAAAIFESARRGDLTAAQLADPRVRKLMQQYPDFEKAVYKNLRDSGNAQVQYADFIDRNPGKIGDDAYDETFGKMSLNQIGEKGNLIDALKEDAKGGGGNLLIHRLADIKDERTIQQMMSRATNKDTYKSLEKLSEYRKWVNAGRPAGGPPGWTGDLYSYMTT